MNLHANHLTQAFVLNTSFHSYRWRSLDKKHITHAEICTVTLKLRFGYIKIKYSVSVKSPKSLQDLSEDYL